MISKIKNIKEKVKKLLTDNPELRDSDDKLLATFWWNQIKKEERGEHKTFEFLKNLSASKFQSAESIMRCRRKIQEQNIELRGKSYKERKNKQVEVRTQIHSI